MLEGIGGDVADAWAWYRGDTGSSPVDPMVDKLGGSGDLPKLSGTDATIATGLNSQPGFSFGANAVYELFPVVNDVTPTGWSLAAIVEGITGTNSLEFYLSVYSGSDTWGYLSDGEMSGETNNRLDATPVLDGSPLVAIWRFGPSGVQFFLDNTEIATTATAQTPGRVAANRITTVSSGGVIIYDAMMFDRELTSEEICCIGEYSFIRYGTDTHCADCESAPIVTGAPPLSLRLKQIFW